MPKVKVDGVEIEVPAGATMLPACELTGEHRLRFRYRQRPIDRGSRRGGIVPVVSTLIHMVLLAAAAIGGVQGASAQLAPGRSGTSTMEYLNREASMAALIDFGECYAASDTRKALRLIATEPSSRAEAATYISLFRNADLDCLGDVTSMSADLPLVRGAIAEGFYRRRVPMPPEMMQSAPALAQVRSLSDAARCYVATHREQVRALLETRPGSRKEFDAVNALSEDLFACVPAGARFKFSATVIRFRLAEALIRTLAPAAGAGS